MKCLIKPVDEEAGLLEISLENGKYKRVGRSSETSIKVKRCSKTQVELTADFSSKTVKVLQVGPNHSALNGKIIGMGRTAKAGEGDVLELLEGELKYKVTFLAEDGEKDGPPPVKLAKIFMKPADNFKKDQFMEQGQWEVKGKNDVLIYVFGQNVKDPKPYVAGFDMDGTIITTKSGKVFPTGPEDWKFLYPQVVQEIRKFCEEHPDYKFMIYTNQAGCKDAVAVENMKKKIKTIISQIGVPALAFVAPNKNKFRKPLTAGWDLFVQEYNGGVVPDLEKSFYCGDAAGRKKDHAMSDRLFALNVGISFKLPEEFFLKSNLIQEMASPIFDPKKYLASHPNNKHVQFGSSQEMIIMVGFPASGKSSFVQNVIVPKGYVRVNRDTLKTQSKCLSVAANALQNQESVVIDNTSPERKDREEYIKLAKKHDVPVRCFKMNVDHGHALHNNKFRELTNNTGASVSAVVYNVFKAKYQEPVKEEGFADVVAINFVPNFEAESIPPEEREFRKKLYCSYLLEK